MANIYCKTLGSNQVGFYLRTAGKEYFLCKQRYYKSLWDYFSGGADIHLLFTKSAKHSYAVRTAKMKLSSYIEYVEREEGVQVLNKTISKGDYKIYNEKCKKSKASSYNWRNDIMAVIEGGNIYD